MRKKRAGRPRKYADSKTVHMVYNKKRPTMRVSFHEKDVIIALRHHPIIVEKLYSNPELIPKVANYLSNL